MTLTNVLAILGTLGGFEAIKWAIHAIAHRKTNARKENASADSMEIQNMLSVIEKLNKQIERYDQRLSSRDDKVDAIYRDWRNAQNEVQQWVHKYHELELKFKEAEVRRCDVRGCKDRIPPSDF